MRKLALVLLSIATAYGQRGGRGAAPAAPSAATRPAAPVVNAEFIRANYTKFEYRITMRDGVKLFVNTYVPKDVFSDGKTYPILMQRTPYNVAPYGVDKYPATLGPSEYFAREKFIFAYADVRGRFMSEGDYTIIRPHNPKKGPKDTDEASDTWDTIDWLVKNVPGNTGKVGMWGISQPGFYAAAGMIDAHPALIAVSPQAPVTDYFMNDDVYHNGAFMLNHRFNFYNGFRGREGPPAPPPAAQPFQYPTEDGYQFFLDIGALANVNEKFFHNQQPYWNWNLEHNTYDEFWQSRAIWRHLKAIKPAVMVVGGWYDTEDPMGPLREFHTMEANTPPALTLVMGPWNHGGFARGDGDRLGNISFGSPTGAFYRENIEFPFFMYYLKGNGDGKFPKAWLFQTGLNQWRKLDQWPLAKAQTMTLNFGEKGTLSAVAPKSAGFDEYISDPARPVPYVSGFSPRIMNTYMTDDQRFASRRPDVLTYQTEPLEQDVTVVGAIHVDLKVSTTGTDSDFDVKFIDVFPSDYPDYNATTAPLPPGTIRVPLGGYQQLIRGEPFRGKFRKSFEKPVAFEPGKPDRITFDLPDVMHTFRAGHRIMVQVQSSWFPLTDRNPQKFMEIPKALGSDFQKATQRIYFGAGDGSKIELKVDKN
jgi:putative CocE/NonD family hydrolase